MKLTDRLYLDLPFADRSTNYFTDTVSGRTGRWTSSPPVGQDSVYGSYVDLDGSADYGTLELPYKQQKLDKVTIEIIQRADSVSQYKRIFHIGVSGDRTHSIEFDNGWGYVFNANWSGGGGAWSTTVPSVGDIDHYFWTYDWGATTNDPVIYKNGLSQTITERATPSGNANNDYTRLYIGSELGTGQYWDGRIYLVRMWRRILTAGEIAVLTNNPYCIYNSSSGFWSKNIGGVIAGAATSVKDMIMTGMIPFSR